MPLRTSCHRFPTRRSITPRPSCRPGRTRRSTTIGRRSPAAAGWSNDTELRLERSLSWRRNAAAGNAAHNRVARSSGPQLRPEARLRDRPGAGTHRSRHVQRRRGAGSRLSGVGRHVADGGERHERRHVACRARRDVDRRGADPRLLHRPVPQPARTGPRGDHPDGRQASREARRASRVEGRLAHGIRDCARCRYSRCGHGLTTPSALTCGADTSKMQECAMDGDLPGLVNWTWGLSLIALTIAIHAIGVVMIALVLLTIRSWLAKRHLGFHYLTPIVICLVTAAGLLLAVLHGIEATIWAAAFLWLGAIDSRLDAILYSLDSMATRGASGLTLRGPWRMMGALEAVDGMLLFGISTAFIFALLQAFWSMLSRRH